MDYGEEPEVPTVIGNVSLDPIDAPTVVENTSLKQEI